jgi:hypothetical protein
MRIVGISLQHHLPPGASLSHRRSNGNDMLLQTLSKGASEARLTREAKASLQRLAKRRDPKP